MTHDNYENRSLRSDRFSKITLGSSHDRRFRHTTAEFTLHPPGPPLRAHARATRNGAGTLNPPRPLHHNAAAARMLLLPGSYYCCFPAAARLAA